MNKYSSTTLNMFQRCPRSLKYWEDDIPYDRKMFAVGVAAHAVLESIGKTRPDNVAGHANEVAKYLATQTRYFRDHAEPPMDIESALTGRDLALLFHDQYGLPDDAEFEIELGMDSDGNACDPESPDCRYHARLDMMHRGMIELDDEYAADTIITSDWKSSWSAGKDQLDLLQFKGHAVLAWVNNKDENVQGITRQLVNIRTGKQYSELTILDEDGEEELRGWRRDILLACDAADKTRAARPGICCMGCHYVRSCEDAREVTGGSTKESLADEYVTLKARTEELAKMMKAATEDCVIPVNGGIIGYQAVDRKSPSECAVQEIMDNLDLDKDSQVKVRWILGAMKPTVGNINAVSGKLFSREDRDEKKEFLGKALEVKTTTQFGVWARKKD